MAVRRWRVAGWAGTLSSACASAGLLPSFTSAQKHVLNCAAGPAQSVMQGDELLVRIVQGSHGNQTEVRLQGLRTLYTLTSLQEAACRGCADPLQTGSTVCCTAPCKTR